MWILARQVDDTVAVTVADDGRGFSAEGGGTGIGLRTVRERLRLAYGAAANGVAATITLPNAVHAVAAGALIALLAEVWPARWPNCCASYRAWRRPRPRRRHWCG